MSYFNACGKTVRDLEEIGSGDFEAKSRCGHGTATCINGSKPIFDVELNVNFNDSLKNHTPHFKKGTFPMSSSESPTDHIQHFHPP